MSKRFSGLINPMKLFQKSMGGARNWENYALQRDPEDVGVDFKKVQWEAGVKKVYEEGEIVKKNGMSGKFGFEIDVISDEPVTRADVAEMLNSHPQNQNPFNAHGPHSLSRHVFQPTDYGDRTRSGWWKIKPDYLNITSTPGQKTKTFQLVSPILSTTNPAQMYLTVSSILSMVKSLNFRTDPCGGLHINLDTSTLTLHELRCAVWNMLKFENGMGLLIPKDRLLFPFEGFLGGNPHSDSKTVLQAANLQSLVSAVNPGGAVGRFRRVNLTNMVLREPHRRETIEVRTHHAVLDPLAVVSWARLCEVVMENGVSKAALDVASDEFRAFSTPPQAHQLRDLKNLLPPDLCKYYTHRRAAVRYLHDTYDKNRQVALSSTALTTPSDIISSLSTLPSPSGPLTYRHGALHDITPRSAEMRDLFPITEVGTMLRSVDSDANHGGEFVPVGDAMDPVSPEVGSTGEF